jgi:membrane protein YqaA with SNARE-associated domain
VAKSADPVHSVAKSLAQQRRLYLWSGAGLGAGAALWLAGFLLIRAFGGFPHVWDALWALTGISFLGSVILPLPGFTSAALFALRKEPLLALFGVLGAAVGGTLGAGLLLALGDTGRRFMRKHAKHSAWSRRMLRLSVRLEKRWTYAGVAFLLVPPFIPRLVVLYAASLVELRTWPYLAAVFAGTFVRNLLVFGAVVGIAWLRWA